jgi:hypothetical protein
MTAAEVAEPTLPPLNTDIFWWKSIVGQDQISNYLTETTKQEANPTEEILAATTITTTTSVMPTETTRATATTTLDSAESTIVDSSTTLVAASSATLSSDVSFSGSVTASSASISEGNSRFPSYLPNFPPPPPPLLFLSLSLFPISSLSFAFTHFFSL